MTGFTRPAVVTSLSWNRAASTEFYVKSDAAVSLCGQHTLAAVPRTCPTYQTRLFSSLFSTFLRNPTSPFLSPPPSPRPYPPPPSTVLDIPGPSPPLLSSDCRPDGLSGLTTLSRERERERIGGGSYLAYERFILVSCFFRFPSIKDLNVGGDCHA